MKKKEVIMYKASSTDFMSELHVLFSLLIVTLALLSSIKGYREVKRMFQMKKRNRESKMDIIRNAFLRVVNSNRGGIQHGSH